MIFDYPARRPSRRHGPRGYSDYASYRPWLRDEFAFRCVYCLKRETWGQVTSEFDLDHFWPQSTRPDLSVAYENLIYACRRCNSIKGNQLIDDPFHLLTNEFVRRMPDWTLQSQDSGAWRLIQILDLNSARLLRWRMTWSRIVELAKNFDRELFRALVSFPSELPDLRQLKPPHGNTRPEGLKKSWGALAEAGQLPNSY